MKVTCEVLWKSWVEFAVGFLCPCRSQRCGLRLCVPRMVRDRDRAGAWQMAIGCRHVVTMLLSHYQVKSCYSKVMTNATPSGTLSKSAYTTPNWRTKIQPSEYRFKFSSGNLNLSHLLTNDKRTSKQFSSE